MFYLKTKYFSRWARKEGVSDDKLRKAIKHKEFIEITKMEVSNEK